MCIRRNFSGSHVLKPLCDLERFLGKVCIALAVLMVQPVTETFAGTVAKPVVESLHDGTTVTAEPVPQHDADGLTKEPPTESEREAVKALVQTLRAFDQFRSEFTQLTQDPEGMVLQEIHGSMQMRRPRQFYWRITEPYHQTIVVNNARLWVVDDNLEQVTAQRLTDQTGLTPAVLLSGDPAEIEEHYRVSRDLLPKAAERYTLIPRAEDALFDQLRVVFRKGLLEEMDFQDSLGQSTAIDFRQGTTHFEVNEALFKAAIPDNYDLIEDK